MGWQLEKIKTANANTIASFFELFLAIKSIIGTGAHILDLISQFDHWLAFILLAIQDDLRVH
jgi:putative Mn2+ efflux pump MntP